MDGPGLFVAQNRKLDVLLVVAAMVGATYLHQHGQHVAAYIAAGIVAIELLANWGGIVGVVFLPVLGVRKAMQLTRRQRRTRTVYKVGGKEWYAVPITRAVQERLAACVPDAAMEASAVPNFLVAAMGGEAPTAADLRKQWMQNITSVYEQLGILLVACDGGTPPDIEWLGDVVPVARANALVVEINERAAIEDNLPA